MDCEILVDKMRRKAGQLLTKNSDVLPEASFTPPPNTVVEVLCTA